MNAARINLTGLNGDFGLPQLDVPTADHKWVRLGGIGQGLKCMKCGHVWTPDQPLPRTVCKGRPTE